MYDYPHPKTLFALELIHRCRILMRLLIDADQNGVRDNLSFILSEQLDLLLKAIEDRRIDGDDEPST
jgi:hypothetical protein